MATGKRESIKLKSTESTHTYCTTKNETNTLQRLKFKKYGPTLRRHVLRKSGISQMPPSPRTRIKHYKLYL